MRRDDGTFLWGGLTAVVLIWIVISSGTRICVSTPATSGPSVLSLSDLSNLKMDNSTVNADLVNLTYWGSVSSAYTTSLAQIIPNTVIGFFDKSAEMRSWAFENIPSPPPWLSSGIVGFMEAQLAFLRVKALAAGNSTLAALIVKSYAASVVGYPVAALDYISMNGVTAIKTYLQTGNVIAAVCATYPSQLGALYAEAFNSSVPRERRAQYLGNALAVTTLMVVLAGKDGFAPKFQDALNRVGLANAWGTIKPYLSRIGSAVSVRASMLTFAILEKVAQRFPQDSTWASGLTADRIESMVEVLHDKGVTNDEIQNDITHVAQAASNSPAEDGAASVADAISYQDGGGITVRVKSQNRMVLYADENGRTQTISAEFLQNHVLGFDPEKASILQVHYKEAGVTVYHYYSGSSEEGVWTPTVPADVAKRGDVITISIDVLTMEDFTRQLPKLKFTNEYSASWVSDRSQVTEYTVSGGQLKIAFSESPLSNVESFEVDGINSVLGFDGKMTHLDFQVLDAFNQPREMRLVYKGYGDAQLRISSGGQNLEFSQVLLVSSDEIRLRFVENTGGFSTSVATIYVKDPSTLYALDDMHEGGLGSKIEAAYKGYYINQVNLQRQLEYDIVDHGGVYDVGRIGAEIAYTIAEEKLGLKNIILEEPSKGGTDLHTPGKTVVIQARMLTDPKTLTPDMLKGTIERQLGDLLNNLKQDKENNPLAQKGYAILSYLDPVTKIIRTIIVELHWP